MWAECWHHLEGVAGVILLSSPANDATNACRETDATHRLQPRRRQETRQQSDAQLQLQLPISQRENSRIPFLPIGVLDCD